MATFSIITAKDANSLSSILVFMTLLLLFIALVLGVFRFRILQVKQDGQKLQAYYNAKSGMQRALERLNDSPSWKGGRLSLFSGDTTSVWVERKLYGGVERLKIHSKVRNERVVLIALLGTAKRKLLDAAFVSADIRTQWTLAGNTEIEGTVYLPAGNWNQQVLPNDGRLPGRHKGKVRPLKASELLKLDVEFLQEQFNQNLNQQDGSTRIEGGTIKPELLDQNEPISVIGDVVLHADSTVRLKHPINWFIDGSITLASEVHFMPGSRIFCTGNLQVIDQIFAQDIWMQSGKQITLSGGLMNGQIWAKEKINLKGNLSLTYPSFVYLTGYEYNRKRFGEIILGNRVSVDGWIFYPPNPKRQDDVGFLKFESGAKVRGAVLNYNRTEGEVWIEGTFLTAGFSFYESPQYYLNWLRDVRIFPSARPTPFDLPLITEDKRPYRILTWYQE